MITDLSLDIIKFKIMPYLLQKDICLHRNKEDIRNYINLKITNNFFYNNLPSLDFKCVGSSCINFENNTWCSFHNKDEFNLSISIIKELRRKLKKSIFKDLIFYNSNIHCVHPENFTKELISTFRKICPKEKYQISHLCCGGLGICFNLR